MFFLRLVAFFSVEADRVCEIGSVVWWVGDTLAFVLGIFDLVTPALSALAATCGALHLPTALEVGGDRRERVGGRKSSYRVSLRVNV